MLLLLLSLDPDLFRIDKNQAYKFDSRVDKHAKSWLQSRTEHGVVGGLKMVQPCHPLSRHPPVLALGDGACDGWGLGTYARIPY